MARRKASGRKATRSARKKVKKVRRSAKRPSKVSRSAASKKRTTSRNVARKPVRKAVRPAPPPRKASVARSKPTPSAVRPSRKAPARLDRERRVLEDTVPGPPSSLNMIRRGSAVRTGRAEMAETLADHANMTPAITGGDVDVDVENAYFTGDEAPGGDNTTPDQDVVDEIGRALGVEYQDSEELRAGDKVTARDKHRWELNPASAEDYKERKP